MRVRKTITLLAFLQEELGISAKKIKGCLERGACCLNGEIERFGTTRLQKGDLVFFDHSHLSKNASSQSLQVLYQDQYLLICNKPTGLVSDQSAFSRLLRKEVFLVHRLDKETSGAILIARNHKMQKALEEIFRKREVTKIYFALVAGRVKGAEGALKKPIEKKIEYQGQTIWGSGSKGRLATTYWKRIKKGRATTLLQCQPITGRTHQIRVHLSDMGHPILGDLLYGRGGLFPEGLHRLLLHAYQLSFTHPATGETLRQIAPITQDFTRFFR